jgi:hypothetical protein
MLVVPIVLEVCVHHPIPCPCAVTMIRVLVVPIRKMMMMKLDNPLTPPARGIVYDADRHQPINVRRKSRVNA